MPVARLGGMRTTNSILGLIDYSQPRSGDDEDASAHPQHGDETHPEPETGEPKVLPGRRDPPAVTLPPLPTIASLVERRRAPADPLDLFPAENP